MKEIAKKCPFCPTGVYVEQENSRQGTISTWQCNNCGHVVKVDSTTK